MRITLLVLCCITYASCQQRWSSRNRWYTRSSWGSDPSYGFDSDRNNGMPIPWTTGFNDRWWDTGSNYRWYSWYSNWQDAPSVSRNPPDASNTPEGVTSQTDIPTETTQILPTRPTRPQNDRIKPQRRGNKPMASRYKRSTDDIMYRDDAVNKPLNPKLRWKMGDPSRREIDNELVEGYQPMVDVRTPPERRLCPDIYSPVCGNDNRTYNNICKLMKAQYQDECIEYAHKGECSSNEIIKCTECQHEDLHFRVLRTLRRLTSLDDWFTFDMEICGTDGVTYVSMCDLCRRKCLDSNNELRAEHRGQCAVSYPPIEGPGTTNNVRGRYQKFDRKD